MEEVEYTVLCTVRRELDEIAYSYCSLSALRNKVKKPVFPRVRPQSHRKVSASPGNTC